MIKVYFQSEIGSHSELVATFQSDEMYQHFIPMLEHLASKQRCFVTETMSEFDIAEVIPNQLTQVLTSLEEGDFNGATMELEDLINRLK